MKKFREIIAPCLVIAALHTPLIWYMLELHSRSAGNTDFLGLGILEQAVIAALIIAPVWCLSSLKIRWRPEEPIA